MRLTDLREGVSCALHTSLALALGSALALASCARAEAGSCYRDRENVCVEYDKENGTAGKRMCAGLTWTPGEKSCSLANRLGACRKKDGTEFLYGGAPNNYTAATAESACVAGGGTFAR